MSKNKIKQKKVAFSIEAANVKSVTLMADFNNWNPVKHPMKNDGNGTWTKTVMLSPGQYEYKFLIDGNWLEDPQSNSTCRNCFGTYNRVIKLEA